MEAHRILCRWFPWGLVHAEDYVVVVAVVTCSSVIGLCGDVSAYLGSMVYTLMLSSLLFIWTFGLYYIPPRTRLRNIYASSTRRA